MTKLIALLCCCALLLGSHLLRAQAPGFQWARSGVSADGLNARSVAFDKGGNVFVTGWYNRKGLVLGTVHLTGISHGSSPSSMFLAKYSTAGSLLWAKEVSGSNEVNSNSLAIDGAGNVYVTGMFRGKAGFGRDSLISSSKNDGYEVFLAKYDGAGQLQWAQTVGSAGAGTVAFSVATDPAGNAYVAGETFDITAFGTARFTTPQSGGFVTKYSATGKILWTHMLGPNTTGYRITVDGAGNAYATVRVVDEVFAFGTAKFPKIDGVVLARFSPTGAPEWARRMPGGVGGLAFDSKGNMLVSCITSNDTLQLDRSHAVYRPKDVDQTLVLTCYQPDGAVRWARVFEGTSKFIECGMGVDAADNAYVAGFLFDMVAPEKGNFAHVAVAGYRPDGTLSWVQHTAGHTDSEDPTAMAVDRAGNVVVIGTYAGTPVFGTTALPTSYTGSTNSLFVAKVGAGAPATSPTAGKK